MISNFETGSEDMSHAEKMEASNLHESKTEAQVWLAKLRAGEFDYEWYLRKIKEKVDSGELSLEFLETSEEELEKLRVLGCATAAKLYFERLASGTELYELTLKQLRLELEKGGLTLTDIETTEAELEEFRVEGCKTAALIWLNLLREQGSGAVGSTNHVNFLRSELHKGGLTLADIDTTDAELASFTKLVA